MARSCLAVRHRLQDGRRRKRLQRDDPLSKGGSESHATHTHEREQTQPHAVTCAFSANREELKLVSGVVVKSLPHVGHLERTSLMRETRVKKKKAAFIYFSSDPRKVQRPVSRLFTGLFNVYLQQTSAAAMLRSPRRLLLDSTNRRSPDDHVTLTQLERWHGDRLV